MAGLRGLRVFCEILEGLRDWTTLRRARPTRRASPWRPACALRLATRRLVLRDATELQFRYVTTVQSAQASGLGHGTKLQRLLDAGVHAKMREHGDVAQSLRRQTLLWTTANVQGVPNITMAFWTGKWPCMR